MRNAYIDYSKITLSGINFDSETENVNPGVVDLDLTTAGFSSDAAKRNVQEQNQLSDESYKADKRTLTGGAGQSTILMYQFSGRQDNRNLMAVSGGHLT